MGESTKNNVGDYNGSKIKNKSIVNNNIENAIQVVENAPTVVTKPFNFTPTAIITTNLPILKLDLSSFKSPETEKPISKEGKGNLETDERRLDQRQKQIDLGKKTLSYYMYCKKIPSQERKKGCPFTPRKSQLCSKRSWDGQVRKWRRMLHEYDPKTTEEIEEALRLFPEETKYLIQKRSVGNVNDEEDDSVETNENNDVY